MSKRFAEQSGGWRRNGRKLQLMKQRDLSGIRWVFIVPDKDTKNHRPGVRDLIVATKPGNSGGAKGVRKMDAV